MKKILLIILTIIKINTNTIHYHFHYLKKSSLQKTRNLSSVKKKKNIKTLKELNEIKSKNPKLLILFFLTSCDHCIKFKPIVKKVSSEFPLVKYIKIDINLADEIVKDMNIYSAPTVITFLNGKQKRRLEGSTVKAMVEHIFAEL